MKLPRCGHAQTQNRWEVILIGSHRYRVEVLNVQLEDHLLILLYESHSIGYIDRVGEYA
jgi:hypothetical protein